jgi:hypothetical protein
MGPVYAWSSASVSATPAHESPVQCTGNLTPQYHDASTAGTGTALMLAASRALASSRARPAPQWESDITSAR